MFPQYWPHASVPSACLEARPTTALPVSLSDLPIFGQSSESAPGCLNLNRSYALRLAEPDKLQAALPRRLPHRSNQFDAARYRASEVARLRETESHTESI